MVLFNKCCCFFRLTTGGLILGWIGAVESLIVIILTMVCLTHVPQIMDHLRNETKVNSIKMEAFNETHVSLFHRHRGEMTTEEEMLIERGMYAVLSLNLIVNFVTLISSLLLITGSIKRNSTYLMPWLICEALCSIFSSFAAISKAFELMFYKENAFEGFGTILSILFFVGIEIYLYLCVYSLYQILKMDEKNQRQMPLNEIQATQKDQHDGLPPYAALH